MVGRVLAVAVAFVGLLAIVIQFTPGLSDGAIGANDEAAWADALETRAVDDAALLAAEPNEWLTYGRDYAETHYSPLDQIHSGNLHELTLAWSWDIGGEPGRLEATPLVSNGVLYATGTWNVVFALDARTGALKWRWDPEINRYGRASGGPSLCCGPVNRGVALYRDKVFVGLLDGRLVALNAETGAIVWERQTTPIDSDYSITGAPRVVNGKVIIGNGGAEFGVRGYVTAYDAETGDQVWRFYTVPGNPAEPFESTAMELAARTWTGEWWKLGGGGTVWDAMAYDPEAALLYIGTGNGSPWSRDHRSPGGGDNLFLASVVALRPDDGEMVWYYQTTPGEQWDYTATQNMILADLIIDGQQRKVLMQAPKNGFFYVLDRLNGELISAEPFADVAWATGVDLETGRPLEAPEARYGYNGAWLSPGPIGAHSWAPMSWNPNTGLVYIPGENNHNYYRNSNEFRPQRGRYNTGVGGAGPPDAPRPTSSAAPAFLLAWDPVQQESRWSIPFDTGNNGGTLATGSNLLVSGTSDGFLHFLDAVVGEELLKIAVGFSPATPISYEIAGTQYIAVLAGGQVSAFRLDRTR